MTRGRKPLPTNMKRLRGNPGKRKLNKDPEVAPMEDGEAPPEMISGLNRKEIKEHARKEWERVRKALKPSGILTEADKTALSMYCLSYGMFMEYLAQIDKFGPIIKSPSGYPIQSPYVGLANSEWSKMKSFLAEFGLTPSGRSRINVPEKGQEKEEIEDFLNRGLKLRVVPKKK